MLVSTVTAADAAPFIVYLTQPHSPCPVMWCVQAIGLPISKLALHTACGGIEPATCMPVVFDVGTDNEELLQSPLYVGVRHRCVPHRHNPGHDCVWLAGNSSTQQ